MDARTPLRSKKLERMVERSGKSLILVLNKADLAPERKVREFCKRLEKRCIPFSVKERRGTRKLRSAILSEEGERPVKVGVAGYPNVGKSSLINVLVGRKVASTSPVPGWTKGEQWIRSGSILFLDTPGVLPGDQSESFLALANAFDPDLLKDPEGVALKILEMTDAAEVYGLEKKGKPALKELAESRGKLLSGGRPNIDFAAKLVVRDLQRGKLKRVKNVKNRASGD